MTNKKNNMASLEHADLCIGESLEKLEEACYEIKKDGSHTNLLLYLGKAMSQIWEARKHIYERSPNLKRDFKKELEQNPQRYEELDEIFQRAFYFEENKMYIKAHNTYIQLLEISKYGFFKNLAQAGLYRTQKAIDSKEQNSE